MKKIIFLAISISLLNLTSFQNAFAIGMMTQPIVIKDILRGQESLATLNLINSEDKEVTYGLKAEGQIATWVTFYGAQDKDLKNPITDTKVPVKKVTDVRVKFNVPKDAPNGKYTGQLLVFVVADGQIKTDQASVNLAQRVGRDVTITVTDKEIVQLS